MKHQDHNLRLLLLLEKMLKASEALLLFSEQKFCLLSCEEDNEIIEMLTEREKYINTLINLENEIDLVLDEYCLSIGQLSSEAEKMRLSVRHVLDRITEKDIEGITLLHNNMQKYKEYTIMARNKKNISAYYKTSVIDAQVNHPDPT